MRHSIFLPVLLSLVLSLSKENDTTTPPETSTPTPPENDTTTPPEMPTPTPPEKISTTLSETSTPTPPENDTSTPSETPTPEIDTTTSSEMTDSPTPENDTSTPSETPTPENDTTTPPETPTPTPPENDTATPSETPTPTPPENDTTTPPETPTPTPPENYTTPSETPTPTPPAGDWCYEDPCGKSLARCVALYSNFTCQCPYGFYYSNKNCHRGQIFPGFIILSVSYNEHVQVLDSMEYEQVFLNITEFFKAAFKDLGDFTQTVIVKIQPLAEGRSSLTTGKMNVTVINLFMENSTVTNATVSLAIEEEIAATPYFSNYSVASYCAAFNCDDHTTDCIESMFPMCVCKSDFSKAEWDDRSCSGKYLASLSVPEKLTCSEKTDCSSCSANDNKVCEKNNGVPKCKCMPNFKMEGSICVACSVGYSGEGCTNNSELILIIVGTVFGAIILGLVIAVSVISVRAKHKQDPEKKSLIRSTYSNSNTSDEKPTTMFPRVQTTSGHANPGYQPNNPYEMRSSNRGPFSERDDDLYGLSQEPEGFRLQKRYK
ncbi:mucin-13 [Cuculus canorus]|nr:mucin-13 [Cuculus canorus]